MVDNDVMDLSPHSNDENLGTDNSEDKKKQDSSSAFLGTKREWDRLRESNGPALEKCRKKQKKPTLTLFKIIFPLKHLLLP